MTPLARRQALGAAFVVAAGASIGCGSSTSTTGVRIGDETLRQFKAGVTTEEWLIAILGEPTSWSIVEGLPNTKVFRYSLDERQGGFFSVFTGSSSQNAAVVYFILTDGVMTRYWTDREVERTITGRRVEEAGGEKAGGLIP